MVIFNYSTIVDPSLKDVRKSVFNIVALNPGEKILDICCGTGDQLFYYAKRGINCFGIDINPNMIKLAEKRKKKRSINNIFFKIGDSTKLPFKDGYFDCVSISLVLHEQERKIRERTIFEMKRVLKNKGSLVFVDFTFPLPKNLFGFFINKIEYLAGKENFKNFKDFLQQGGLEKILKENNIREEKKIFLKKGTMTIIKGTKNE